jgi:transcriptional regulator with XRE-family HTH domain
MKDENDLNLDFKGLGGRLELERISRKLSRAKLAELAGVNPNSLAKWEKAGQAGGKYPPLPKLTRLCKILEIDPREIFNTVYEQEEFREDPEIGGGVPFNNPDYFNFVDHFASDTDWTKWQLSVKNFQDLNDTLMSMHGELHFYGQRLKTLEHTLKKNGSDHEDPSRPLQNTPKAVDAASNHLEKEDDQK